MDDDKKKDTLDPSTNPTGTQELAFLDVIRKVVQSVVPYVDVEVPEFTRLEVVTWLS